VTSNSIVNIELGKKNLDIP